MYRYPRPFLRLELIFLLLFLLLYDQLALDRTRVVFAFTAKERLVLQCSRRRRRLSPDSRPNPAFTKRFDYTYYGRPTGTVVPLHQIRVLRDFLCVLGGLENELK